MSEHTIKAWMQKYSKLHAENVRLRSVLQTADWHLSWGVSHLESKQRAERCLLEGLYGKSGPGITESVPFEEGGDE